MNIRDKKILKIGTKKAAKDLIKGENTSTRLNNYRTMQNILILETLRDAFEKWNQKLSTMLIAIFASMDRLCPKNVIKDTAEEE